MNLPQTGPLRATRSFLVAAMVCATGALGHVVGGGEMPRIYALLLVMGLTWAVAYSLAARRLRVIAVGALFFAGQALLHLVSLLVDTSVGLPSHHLHGENVGHSLAAEPASLTYAAEHAQGLHEHALTWPMLAAHLGAALLCLGVVHRAETWLWTVLRWVTPLFVNAPTPTFPTSRRLHPSMTRTAGIGVWRALRCAPRRGPPTSTRGPLVLLASLALVLSAGFAAPVQAHDQLRSSSPADRQVVATVPSSLTLQYTANLLNIPPVVVISHASGTKVATAAPVVQGDTVTVGLPAGQPAGVYTVAWSVVSSDGHPIEGVFTFTASSGPTASPSPTAATTSAPAPTVAGEPARTESGSTGATGFAITTTWWLVGVGGPLLLGLVLLMVSRRRRRNHDTTPSSSR